MIFLNIIFIILENFQNYIIYINTQNYNWSLNNENNKS